MKTIAIAIGLLMFESESGLAQALNKTDIAAIERAAADYVVSSLPKGVIGFDANAFSPDGRTRSRDAGHVDILLRSLRATKVREDSVYSCSERTPASCRLSVDALVRVGEPFPSQEGARVFVEFRRHTNIGRQPIGFLSKELILSKADGSWKVVGVGRRNAT
jgi:hypothetical protein